MTQTLISRRKALALGAAAFAAPSLITRASAATVPVLVELFTSQGCSSCPPADVQAGLLSSRDDVIVVSFNVDYWDYLGWRDTLAKKEYTQRQYDYAGLRGDGRVYTPQMVINGGDHVVGSDKSGIKTTIANAIAKSDRVALQVSVNKDDIIVEVPKGAAVDATLWLMAVTREVVVDIKRGENTGLKNTYHNVVSKLVPAGMWHGDAQKFMLPRKAIMVKGSTSCVAVLQKGQTGSVIGLGQWAVPNS